MKAIKFFKLAALLSVLAGSLVFCGEEEEPDSTCPPCEHKRKFLEKKTYENILMYDISKSDMTEIKKDERDEYIYVYVDFETETASLNRLNGNFWTCYYICNLPFDRIPEIIPQDGLSIDIAGDVYETCEPQGFIPEHSFFNIVLTSLKIQTK